MKQFFKFASDKPTKTDKKNAKVIAQFMEYSKENNNTISEELKYQLRYLVREKENITYQIARLKTDIKRILVLTFHEIEKFNVFSPYVISILLQLTSNSIASSYPVFENILVVKIHFLFSLTSHLSTPKS